MTMAELSNPPLDTRTSFDATKPLIIDESMVFTNTPSTGPYRGAGRPESVLGLERGIDVLARELGIDPIAVRKKNFIQPDEFPYTTPSGCVYDSGNYPRMLQVAKDLIGWDRWQAERAKSHNED